MCQHSSGREEDYIYLTDQDLRGMYFISAILPLPTMPLTVVKAAQRIPRVVPETRHTGERAGLVCGDVVADATVAAGRFGQVARIAAETAVGIWGRRGR